jgi:hypothetical protein
VGVTLLLFDSLFSPQQAKPELQEAELQDAPSPGRSE